MEYKIIGEPMPVVECKLKSGEAMKTESGSMAWMSDNMKMETTSGGGLGKMFGRMLSGESLFQNIYTAQNGDGLIAFGSSFVGSIRAYQLAAGQSIICQKSAFLASETSVELSTYFQKKIGVGILGGEGFIMQKVTGPGLVFIEIDGSAVEYDLANGQVMLINPGSLAIADASVKIDIQDIKGVKNLLLGGEDWFQTKVTGPGKVVVQTMSIAGFASVLSPFFEKGNR
ncbi:MAG: TIGR00266 family protein [Oscillospiraceae bacterium]|jgi:uncharacterized protein (TIGR00266 family)|nr:TIGR00266 family protein [Oscillospiraceae bacterium]